MTALMAVTPTHTFFSKLAISFIAAWACALSAGLMISTDGGAMNGQAATALLLVGVSVYLLAALAQSALTVILRRLFG